MLSRSIKPLAVCFSGARFYYGKLIPDHKLKSVVLSLVHFPGLFKCFTAMETVLRCKITLKGRSERRRKMPFGRKL